MNIREAFNEMTAEAGWNDASRTEVLMDFLEKLIKEGKTSANDFVDFADERCADEANIGRPNEKVIELRCNSIVEQFKEIMDPSCTVILDELYEENIDHWEDGNKTHVFMKIRSEFNCKMIEAVKIAQILFGDD